MSTWQVRQEGSPTAVAVPSAEEVAAGLRDGVWLPTDEVKGPGDAAWTMLEGHPVFAEVAAEQEDPGHEVADETHLDMNPLIDVCLVLLIFFILTISYASLERSLTIPETAPEEKGASIPKIPLKDIRDRVFIVSAVMEGDKVAVRLEKELVPIEQLDGRIKDLMTRTGRSEMLLDLDTNVPWGVQTAILDAAKGNGAHNVLLRARPKR
ncbi:MAG TPA: biopolymer transporter ExbD [Urbifossiella sp.]|jgi:biopolymer transport protein ExbD|nr:biopolymer transporter ExbD [Urbifossiella sp.]